MLFQPTNVIPDLKSGIGLGVVDARYALAVSWQVNGDYPVMTGMKIDLYVNDAASTQIYSTGKVSFETPFYGTDALGQPQYYSYSIPRSELADLNPEFVNGHEYKLIITQYYNDRGTEKSVVQSSASVFITRRDPIFDLADPIPATVGSCTYTFELSFTQTNGDTLDWVRYQIAQGSDTAKPIYDSGTIYGAAVYECTYRSFRSGYNYSFRAFGQTSSGTPVDTGWNSFTVSYTVSEVSGAVVAEGARNLNGIAVSWNLTGTGSRWLVYREQADSPVLVRVADVSGDEGSIFDYGAASGQGPYSYLVFDADAASQIVGVPVRSDPVRPVFYRWTLLTAEEQSNGSYLVTGQFHFHYNLDSGSVSNNNSPNVLKNFTANPTVQRAPQNYLSGTLKGLAGAVFDGRYTDTLDVRKALMALSTDENPIFLKSSKGDVLRIMTAGPVTAAVTENTEGLPQTVSVPWIALEDAAEESLYAPGG